MPLCLQLFAMVTNGTGGNSFTLVSNTWFDIIKTKQTKLPESITIGAQTGKDVKDWKEVTIPKKKKKKKSKWTEPNPRVNTDKKQTQLDLTEE